MIITVDFETYYSRDFSLSKITTEEYVRSDEFEVIGVGVKVDDGETQWFSGTFKDTAAFLSQFDWGNALVLAHNTAFDGAILSWRFGIRPKGWLDTLCMARAVNGVDASASLKSLAERYGIGEKGTEVVNALGMRRVDFSPEQLEAYASYCRNDVDLCKMLFEILMAEFPTKELKVIDTTLRMFIEPTLVLDLPLLEQHLGEVKARKEKLLEVAAADRDTLMSNDKFAELLGSLLRCRPRSGLPRKISPTTGRETWAFAKTDEGFKELAEHPDERVQALVAARLGNKTTLEETRTQRFIDIAKRGLMPVPLKYYAAHTGRWGGEDKINLQNLPSRGQNAGKLKSSICPPTGYVMIDADSSQIEARIVAWLAGQVDLVELFNKNNEEIASGVKKKDMLHDPYKNMAAQIYSKEVLAIDDHERFVGKTTILGAGYGMGGVKFKAQLKTFNFDIDDQEANRIVQVYRQTYSKIPELWDAANRSLECILTKRMIEVGRSGVLEFDPREEGFKLPNGLWLRYRGLRKEDGQYVYKTRRGDVKVYGGKVVENLCQALARCVIAEQMLLIAKRYKVVLTVHDAVACVAPIEERDEAIKYVEQCMKHRPDWCKDLPLNCEVGSGFNYGEC